MAAKTKRITGLVTAHNRETGSIGATQREIDPKQGGRQITPV